MTHIYRVYRVESGRWAHVPFAEGVLSYCNGYVDAMDSLYPSPAYQIRKFGIVTRDMSIVRETNGRNAVHTN